MFDDLPPGGFDLVLVADLAPYVRAPALLAQLAEQVSGTGVLVGGIRNPAGLALAQLMEQGTTSLAVVDDNMAIVGSVNLGTIEQASKPAEPVASA